MVPVPKRERQSVNQKHAVIQVQLSVKQATKRKQNSSVSVYPHLNWHSTHVQAQTPSKVATLVKGI